MPDDCGWIDGISLMGDDDDNSSTQLGVEDAVEPSVTFSGTQLDFEGPELMVFSIDEVAGDMDGHYDEGEIDEGSKGGSQSHHMIS